MVPDAFGLEGSPGGATDPPDDSHRLFRQEIGGFRAADDGEAAGFVEFGCHLGEELVVREPDGDGEVELALDAPLEPGEQDRGRGPVQAFGAGEIEEGFIERERFDEGGKLGHHRADLARDLDVMGHAGFDHDGFGAASAGLEHRHGGPDPAGAGEVAGGGDHAALAAADDERHIRKLRIVPLFDRSVERVAIHVRNGEVAEFRVAEDARTAALRAPAGLGPFGEAISAEAVTCVHVMTLAEVGGLRNKARNRFA